MKVLITGVSGKIGRLVAKRLCTRGHQVIGIDVRPWAGAPQDIEVHLLDIRKRAAEDVFRKCRPEGVIHMATVTHLRHQSEDRYRINLHGTRAVFDHCHRYSAKRAVFVGRHTYYGAAHDEPLYHKEDDPPNAVTSFPELADLVAADLYAGSALWRFPELSTAVLRICYTLGPSRSGTLANFLRGPRVPSVLGFDPLFQFMHEQGVAEASCLGLEPNVCGVYNVSGPPPVPLSLLIANTGRRRIPVPESLFRFVLGRLGLPSPPPGAIKHLKYPVVMDSTAFAKLTGFHPEHDEAATMKAFRDSF